MEFYKVNEGFGGWAFQCTVFGRVLRVRVRKHLKFLLVYWRKPQYEEFGWGYVFPDEEVPPRKMVPAPGWVKRSL